MNGFFEESVATIERPAIMDAGAPADFWRRENPGMINGVVVRGGMWGPQRDWWNLPNFIKGLVGGYGCGKTNIAGKRAIAMALHNAPCPIAVVSPSFPLARKTIILTIGELLAGKQTLFGRALWWHYNRSIHEFKIRYHGRVATIYVCSGDNPLSLRGPNLAAAYIDEPFIMAFEVFQQMVARVRHPLARQREIGLTGCVIRKTLILPESGMRTIGSVDPGTQSKQYKPLALCLYGSRRAFHQSTQFFNNGFAETCKVTVQNGYQLEATPDHPILVMGAEGKPVWRQTGLLCLGDRVAVGRGMNVWGNVNPLVGMTPYFIRHRHNKINHPLVMTEDLAYFLGLWVAEGSCQWASANVSISCGDLEVQDRLCKAGVLGLKFKRAGDTVQVKRTSQALVQVMRHLGMPQTKSPRRFIPQWVFEGCREWALAFLAGMYDGDGHVCKNLKTIGYSTTSPRLARELQCLLLNLGVVTHRRRVYNAPSEKVAISSVVYHVKADNNRAAILAKMLPLRIRRKRELLAKVVESRDSDTIPEQGKLVLEAWGRRKRLRWSHEHSNLEANKIIETVKKYHGEVSYSTLIDFVGMWESNEIGSCEAIDKIKTNLRDWYYWATVTKLERGEAETVDFVVPDTHSFWSNGFISHNSPEQLNWGWDLFQGELKEKHDVGMINASTRTNLALDSGYVKRLEASLSTKAAEAYVEGRFVNLAEGQVYYAFSDANIQDLPIPEGAKLGCGMDFNVNPMALSIFWQMGDHMHFFGEHELPNADTEYACQFLKDTYGHLKHSVINRQGSLEERRRLNTVYPDVAGSHRHTNAPGGKTDYTYIREAGFDIDAPSASPLRKDRYNTVNGKLKPKSGTSTLTISPKCKKLIKYISTYTHELMNRQKPMSHLLDAFSYPVAYLFPLDKDALQVVRLTGV